MSSQGPKRTHEADEHTSNPESARRKVRKGTQSCWECKKRKIKCTRSAPFDPICDGCRSRSTPCVGQDMEDEPSSARMLTASERGVGSADISCLSAGKPTALLPSRATVKEHHGDELRQIANRLTRSEFNEARIGLATAAVKYWPLKRDIDVLSNNTAGSIALSHGMICAPYKKYFDAVQPSPETVLPCPSAEEAHPVLSAKRFLMLAVYLQALPSNLAERNSSERRFPHQAAETITYAQMKKNLFKSATKFVLGDTELLGSIEGIECVILQSMYLNNEGNLRGAWLANRKAISLAQVLGLDNGSAIVKSMVIEAKTMTRIEAESMWLRLNSTDKYLSLMLGLPQASTHDWNTDNGDRNQIGYAGMQYIESVTTKAASMMLSRLRSGRSNLDLKEAMEIDVTLQHAAYAMDPRWWACAPRDKYFASTRSPHTLLWRTLTITLQLAYRYMILNLHLPFLLANDDSSNSDFAYSKLAVVSASREILRLFLDTSEWNRPAAYCRGADFIAFTASIALIFAHLEAREKPSTKPNYLTSIRYQRQTDLGSVGQVYGIWHEMSVAGDDVAQRLKEILGHMRDIEFDVHNGSYFVSELASFNGTSPQDFRSCILHACGTLEICIPHVGAIKIRRLKAGAGAQTSQQTSGLRPEELQNQTNGVSDEDESLQDLLQGVDFAFFQNLGSEWDFNGFEDASSL